MEALSSLELCCGFSLAQANTSFSKYSNLLGDKAPYSESDLGLEGLSKEVFSLCCAFVPTLTERRSEWLVSCRESWEQALSLARNVQEVAGLLLTLEEAVHAAQGGEDEEEEAEEEEAPPPPSGDSSDSEVMAIAAGRGGC